MMKKAVLLSGPPGIGKTSSALILCRELGFEPIEVFVFVWTPSLLSPSASLALRSP